VLTGQPAHQQAASTDRVTEADPWQAGARSAIGTLWYVDDVVTSAFFVPFYRDLDAGLATAESLQPSR
jgi:hypothetical protein